MRHREDQSTFAKNGDRTANRPPGDAEFLDQLQLARDGSVWLPVTTLYPLGEDLDELEVRRYWPIRLNHYRNVNDRYRPDTPNHIVERIKTTLYKQMQVPERVLQQRRDAVLQWYRKRARLRAARAAELAQLHQQMEYEAAVRRILRPAWNQPTEVHRVVPAGLDRVVPLLTRGQLAKVTGQWTPR